MEVSLEIRGRVTLQRFMTPTSEDVEGQDVSPDHSQSQSQIQPITTSSVATRASVCHWADLSYWTSVLADSLIFIRII